MARIVEKCRHRGAKVRPAYVDSTRVSAHAKMTRLATPHTSYHAGLPSRAHAQTA
jgi:hypothetical protein